MLLEPRDNKTSRETTSAKDEKTSLQDFCRTENSRWDFLFLSYLFAVIEFRTQERTKPRYRRLNYDFIN
jgi:hypothetical protein